MLAGRVAAVRRAGGGAHATVYRMVALVLGLAISVPIIVWGSTDGSDQGGSFGHGIPAKRNESFWRFCLPAQSSSIGNSCRLFSQSSPRSHVPRLPSSQEVLFSFRLREMQ